VLDEEGVVADHEVNVVVVVRFLYVVADVVHARPADVSACPLELMRALLHGVPVLLVHRIRDHFEAVCERHSFEALEHRDVEGGLATEILDWSDQVDRLRNVEVADPNHETLVLSQSFRRLGARCRT